MHIRIILTNGETKWVWSYRVDPFVEVYLTDEWNQSTPVPEAAVGAVVGYLLDTYEIVSLYVMRMG